MALTNDGSGDDLAKKIYIITAVTGALFFLAALIIL